MSLPDTIWVVCKGLRGLYCRNSSLVLFNNIAWVTANNFERAAGCTSKKWRDMLRVLQVVGNKEDTPQSLREWAAEKHITLPDPDEELAIKDSIIPYEDDSVPLDGVGPWPRAPLVEGFIAVEHPTLGGFAKGYVKPDEQGVPMFISFFPEPGFKRKVSPKRKTKKKPDEKPPPRTRPFDPSLQKWFLLSSERLPHPENLEELIYNVKYLNPSLLHAPSEWVDKLQAKLNKAGCGEQVGVELKNLSYHHKRQIRINMDKEGKSDGSIRVSGPVTAYADSTSRDFFMRRPEVISAAILAMIADVGRDDDEEVELPDDVVQLPPTDAVQQPPVSAVQPPPANAALVADCEGGGWAAPTPMQEQHTQLQSDGQQQHDEEDRRCNEQEQGGEPMPPTKVGVSEGDNNYVDGGGVVSPQGPGSPLRVQHLGSFFEDIVARADDGVIDLGDIGPIEDIAGDFDGVHMPLQQQQQEDDMIGEIAREFGGVHTPPQQQQEEDGDIPWQGVTPQPLQLPPPPQQHHQQQPWQGGVQQPVGMAAAASDGGVIGLAGMATPSGTAMDRDDAQLPPQQQVGDMAWQGGWPQSVQHLPHPQQYQQQPGVACDVYATPQVAGAPTQVDVAAAAMGQQCTPMGAAPALPRGEGVGPFVSPTGAVQHGGGVLGMFGFGFDNMSKSQLVAMAVECATTLNVLQAVIEMREYEELCQVGDAMRRRPRDAGADVMSSKRMRFE